MGHSGWLPMQILRRPRKLQRKSSLVNRSAILPCVNQVEVRAVQTDSLQNTFLNYFSHFTSIYEAVSADLLHQIELGVFGRHFWLWVISKGDNPGGYLSDEELDTLDDRYSVSTM